MNLESLQNRKEKLTELAMSTGMPVTQENGQRIYGPPIGEIIIPSRGSEVYVDRLPRDCFENEIVPLFAEVGRIHTVRILMDFSGTNRGYCFVQYYTPAEANQAIMKLNNSEIRQGWAIRVAKSVDNRRLYLGGMPNDKTREQIFDEMNKLTEGLIRVDFSTYTKPSNIRGFAFLVYESHKAAALARSKMISRQINLWGAEVTVDWAKPKAIGMDLYVKRFCRNTTKEVFNNQHVDNYRIIQNQYNIGYRPPQQFVVNSRNFAYPGYPRNLQPLGMQNSRTLFCNNLQQFRGLSNGAQGMGLNHFNQQLQPRPFSPMYFFQYPGPRSPVFFNGR